MNFVRSPREMDLPSRSVLAMACALLIGWALGRTGLVPFAAESLAQAIMARTPPDLANELLLRWDRLARPFALLGGIATYLGVAALIGLPGIVPALGRRAGFLSPLLLLLWLVLVITFDLPWLPNLILAALFISFLVGLSASVRFRPRPNAKPTGGHANADRQAAPGQAGQRLPARRDMLRGVAVSSAAVMVMANVAFIDAIRRGAAGRGQGGRSLFAWEPPPARLPGFDLAGLPPEVTPLADFYRMSKNVVDPEPDGALWRLMVGSRRWTLADMQALSRADTYCTLRCISNRVDTALMSTALFSGVRLRDLLTASGVPLEGECVVFEGMDGHRDSIPLAAAEDDETLIAWAMNGRELTRDHGYPARLLIPGRYGFKSVKWLRRIRVSATPYSGNWQDLGWTRDALVKTMARIDVAERGAEDVTAAGIAFAGSRGISAVRVRFDDGAWQEAVLHQPPVGRSTWVQWRATGPAGARAVVARAVDGAGNEQPEAEQGQFPDGAQGLHRVSVRARR